MSQEIVFTSARHGLRTGSTGFCTVRSTRGMPGNLAQLLERLTSYSHVFDAYGDQANLNPVNFAHYIARLGDQKFHILARVSNAPLDHTNRSNKLAHLLAVDSSQLETAHSEGPAAESLKVPWIREWSSDTEPYVLPDEKQIDLPMLDQPKSGSCNAWKEATGDAGWAAVLATSAGDTSDAMQVIMPRDAGSRQQTWALQLVHEALSLIPPARRWDVSYSTFFGGNLPVSINCRWQFILDGTDAAKRARLDPRAKTIDIPGIAARKIPAPQLPLTPLTNVATRPWDDSQEDSIARRRTRVSADPSIPDRSTSEASGNIPHVETTDAVIDEKPAFAIVPKRKATGAGVSDRRRRSARGPFLLHPASLLTLGVIIVVTLVMAVQQLPVEESSAAAKIMAEANEKALSREQQEKKQEKLALKKQRDQEARARLKQEAEEQARLLASSSIPLKNVAAQDSTVEAEPQPAEAPTSREPALPPLQDVRDRGNRLQISLPSVGLNSGPDGPIQLARIYVDSLNDFMLKKIIGGRSVLKPGLDFSLEQRDIDEQPFRDWDVIRRSTTGVDLGGNPDIVGTFRLDQNSELSFRWHKGNEGFEIINCLLEMEAGDPDAKPEREKCTLREVRLVKPMRFDPANAEWLETLVGRKELANTEVLELHCDFVNLPGLVPKTGARVLHVDDAVMYHMQGISSEKYPRKVEIRLELVKTEQDVRIAIGMTLEMPVLNQGNGKVEVKQVPFTPKLMGKMDDDIGVLCAEIEKGRDALKRARVRLKTLRDDLPDHRNKKGEVEEEFQKSLDQQQKTVDNTLDFVKAGDAEVLELRSLQKDLNTMLVDIAMHGQLQFSLRLMIPDAGAEGIELVKTDDGVAAE